MRKYRVPGIPEGLMLINNSRPVSQSLARSDSTKKYFVYVMGGSGLIVLEGRKLMILFLR